MMLSVEVGQIEHRILFIRGEKAIIDADLAGFYGVPTKRLNEQVKRNHRRFPQDFVFELTATEKSELVAKCDQLSKLKYSKTMPYAFTEHGALMAASVLSTRRAGRSPADFSHLLVVGCWLKHHRRRSADGFLWRRLARRSLSEVELSRAAVQALLHPGRSNARQRID